MAEDGQLILDEARDFFFSAQCANERNSDVLAKFVEMLKDKKPNDEWLEALQEEAGKALQFHTTQVASWQLFCDRVEGYIDEVKQAAAELAMLELQGKGPDDAQVVEKQGKFLHPELVKFKQQKQARILGKYGGVPALGPGVVLPRAPRDVVTNATGSAAAREIHFSKMEGKDARELASVMQYKKSAGGGSSSGSSVKTPWQQEMAAKRPSLDKADAASSSTSSTPALAASPFGNELSGALRNRMAAVKQAEEESERAAAAARSVVPLPGSQPPQPAVTNELMEKLRRRQAEQS